MRKLITTLLLFIPTFAFSQTVVKDTIISKVKVETNKVLSKNQNNQELDDEYTERPFKGKEESIKITPYIGMTDHEEYNAKLKKIKN